MKCLGYTVGFVIATVIMWFLVNAALNELERDSYPPSAEQIELMQGR